MAAVRAAGTGKAVGEDAAVEIAPEFALGLRRGVSAAAVVVQRQPGGEVCLHDAVEESAFGLASVVNSRRAGFCGWGGHGYPDRGIGRLTVCPSGLCVHPVAQLLDGSPCRPTTMQNGAPQGAVVG